MNGGADIAEGHALLLRVDGRRRLVLSVAAAERALERAGRRGVAASVELVRLLPVPTGHVPGRHEVVRDADGVLRPNTREGR